MGQAVLFRLCKQPRIISFPAEGGGGEGLLGERKQTCKHMVYTNFLSFPNHKVSSLFIWQVAICVHLQSNWLDIMTDGTKGCHRMTDRQTQRQTECESCHLRRERPTDRHRYTGC